MFYFFTIPKHKVITLFLSNSYTPQIKVKNITNKIHVQLSAVDDEPILGDALASRLRGTARIHRAYVEYNRGLVRRGAYLYAHDYATSLGTMRYGENMKKKTIKLSINFMEGFEGSGLLLID